MATTAALIRSISVSGYGVAAASGSAYFYQPGTTVQVPVYQDSAGAAVYPQPVALDGSGRSVNPVYSLAPVRMQVFSATGALLDDYEVENVVTADQVALNSPSFGASYGSLDDAVTAMVLSNGAGGGLVKASGSGAVARSLQSKLGEPYVSVADYGAKGDGVADDTGAFVAAVAVIKSAGSGELFIPSGTFKVTTSILVNITGYFRVRGNGKSSVIAPTFAGTIFTIQGATGINFASFAQSGTTASLITIATTGVTSLYFVDLLCIGTALLIWSAAPVGIFCTFLSCRSYTDVDNGTIGPLTQNVPGTGTTQNVLGCIGNIGGVGTGGQLTRIGGYGNVTSSSAGTLVSMVGGGGVINVTSPAPSPVVLGPISVVGGIALGTDTAVDSVYVLTATGTVATSPVQGQITLKANTAGITVTVQLTPISRINSYQTICFWNNTGGAVTWAAGPGITFRAGVPAPGSGLKVYVTFIADPNTTTYVEVART